MVMDKENSINVRNDLRLLNNNGFKLESTIHKDFKDFTVKDLLNMAHGYWNAGLLQELLLKMTSLVFRQSMIMTMTR